MLVTSGFCDLVGCPHPKVNARTCAAHAGVTEPQFARHRFEVWFGKDGKILGARGRAHGLMQYDHERWRDEKHAELFAYLPDHLGGLTKGQLRTLERMAIEEDMSEEPERILIVHSPIHAWTRDKSGKEGDMARRAEIKKWMPAAVVGELQRVGSLRWGGAAKSNDQMLLDARLQLARMRLTRKSVYTRFTFDEQDVASPMNPFVMLVPHYDPCTHPMQERRYDAENKLRELVCNVCEQVVDSVKGKMSNCFSCRKPYLAYTWDDPSGCPHCNRSFVD